LSWQLKKCLCVPEDRVEVRRIKLKSDLVYEEKSVTILEVKTRVTQKRVVKLYKVVGVIIVSVMQRGKGRIICETLILLSMLNGTLSKSQNEIFIRGRAVTPQCHACIIALSLHQHKVHSSIMSNIHETSI
jgi:hypothetical protein